MGAKEIKKIMKSKGLKVNTLAERLCYGRHHVTNVIHGKQKSRRARTLIARELEMKPEQLWPEN